MIIDLSQCSPIRNRRFKERTVKSLRRLLKNLNIRKHLQMLF